MVTLSLTTWRRPAKKGQPGPHLPARASARLQGEVRSAAKPTERRSSVSRLPASRPEGGDYCAAAVLLSGAGVVAEATVILPCNRSSA
jgi:hypothetical protein